MYDWFSVQLQGLYMGMRLIQQPSMVCLARLHADACDLQRAVSPAEVRSQLRLKFSLL